MKLLFQAQQFAILLFIVICCNSCGGPQQTSGPPGAKPLAHHDAPEYRVIQDRSDRLIAQLPNRLIVVVARVQAAPVVSAQVWVKTGSIYEQEHVGAGLSHFLEHLISGGTTATRSEAQNNDLLSRIGAQTNAATSLDTVRYYINTTSEHAATAIDLLSDWMQHSLITDQEYERERSVIQREFSMGQGDPRRILWKLTQQARYRVHPARHPTIGYLDEFLTITRDEIYRFYKRMYVPNNMVFVVVGDIDKQRVVDQIASLWANQEPADLPKLQLPIETRPPTPRELTGTADIDQPRLRLAWPGTRLGGPHDYALDLLTTILGHGESSRLVRTVRDEQRRVNTIDAYNLSFPWGQGFVGIDAQVAVPPQPSDDNTTAQQWRDQHLASAKQAILDQLQAITQGRVSDQELDRAKRKAMASVVYSAQSAQSIASRLARDLIGMGDPDYLQRYAQAIQAITAQELHAAAKQYLRPEAMITVTLLPQPADAKPQPLTRPQPPTDEPPAQQEPVDLDNAALLARLVSATQAHDAPAAAMAVEPIRRYVLPNGLRLLVGQSTVVPAVAIQMYHLGGLLADPPGQEGLTHATAAMRIKGTATRTAQQIAQQVEDLGATLNTASGYNTSFTRAVCLQEDWPTVLALVADVTLNPTFPDDEWAKLQPRLLAAIDRQTDTWSGELRKRFREAYFSDHVWAHTPAGQRSMVETLNAETLRTTYQHQLAASQSVLAVIGDVDPDQVYQQVERLFASMPAKPKQPFEPRQPNPTKDRVLQYQTSKPLAAVQIGFGPIPARHEPDYADLQVLANALSRFPGGLLEQQLRGQGPGLVYAVGAGPFTGLVPGYLAVLFNTQPSSVDEALGRSLAVIEQLHRVALDDANLAAAKAKVLADEFLYKQTHSDRATDAALNELYGLGLDEPQRFRKQVQRLSAQQLQAIAQRYLTWPVTVVLSHQPMPEDQLHQAAQWPQAQPDSP